MVKILNLATVITDSLKLPYSCNIFLQKNGVFLSDKDLIKTKQISFCKIKWLIYLFIINITHDNIKQKLVVYKDIIFQSKLYTIPL